MRRILLIAVSSVLFLFYSFAQAPNDECATAITISSLPYNTSQNTRLATANANDPVISCNDAGKGLGKTVWFKYTPASSHGLWVSTIGSTPTADYDIMLGVFIGTCGNLTEVKCNDDAQNTRQSELFLNVTAGITYYILVGEWNDGGTNGGTPTGGDLVLNVYSGTAPAFNKGPKKGSVASGVTVSVSNIPNAEPITEGENLLRFNFNNPEPPLREPLSKIVPQKYLQEKIKPLAPEGSNYFEDKSAIVAGSGKPIILKSFQAFPQTNSIPPDPILAVGLNHVVVMVNTSFRIYTKEGVLQKNISASSFYNSLAPGTGPNDPQIVYDHFANRWVMLWMTSPTATDHRHLIAVSDDHDPNGTWYQWNLPATALGDSITGGWGDFPALGYDSVSIYITDHQFPLAGGNFMYDKLRIIPKAQLYTGTAGKIDYVDFWDFRDPSSNSLIFDLRPYNAYQSLSKAFMINTPQLTTANYVTLWTIDNPGTLNPSITADNVPVTAYSNPPSPLQLGGGSPAIENGGKNIRANAIYRDSAIWAVHSIASGSGNSNSAARYMKINPFSLKVLEDAAIGTTGYFHIYPAIAVNKNKDILITYTRSSANEYLGAFITGRRSIDPPGLSPSVVMQAGAGNYVVTGGGTRNRWGDYNGAAVDPADMISMWAHTEYASFTNQWATWTAKAQISPLAGVYATITHTNIDLGKKSVGTSTDTVTFSLTNEGMDTLIVSEVKLPGADFKFIGLPSAPFKLSSLSSVDAKVFFVASKAGQQNDSIVFTTNAVNNPKISIKLKGYGFQIVTAQIGKLYATSGTADTGKLYIINSGNGVLTEVGITSLPQVASLRVHPKTKELIGYDPTGGVGGGAFYRISSTGLSAQQISNVALANLKGFALYSDSMAYMGRNFGQVYKVNIYTGTYVQLGTTALNIGGLALNPVNGTLWMTLRATSGTTDNVYKVNTSTGTATLVGSSGLGVGITDITFDKNGKLYGISGIGSTLNQLVTIDTTTGAATVIGPLGKSGILALALDQDGTVNVASNSTSIPNKYSLEQNYPNPFNPSTVINYQLPKESFVTLKLYDAIGREVAVLVNEEKSPGYFSVEFNASKFASGIYFYKLQAGSYTSVKKMVLVK